MTPNIDITLKSYRFGQLDDTKWPQKYIWGKPWFYIFNINCITVGGTLYTGTPGGQIPKFWQKITQMLILC